MENKQTKYAKTQSPLEKTALEKRNPQIIWAQINLSCITEGTGSDSLCADSKYLNVQTLSDAISKNKEKKKRRFWKKQNIPTVSL